MQKDSIFPEGFYWGETRWGLVARPDWSEAKGGGVAQIFFRKLCVTGYGK
ncbi:MAG: hypothetical protein WD605_00495 [Candidatus Paceibacterota bacterium]